jgi:pimeloyl-ACP methyl ester carboxylesterase
MMQYRSWGVSEGPLVLLLHAQGGHSGWWTWTAPLLAGRFHVVAPDFRGHGASDLAGHSMGAYVGLLGTAHGLLSPAGLMLIDMKTGATVQELADLEAASHRTPRPFATLEEAVARYRLAPPEHTVPAERLAAVAAESFRQSPEGWLNRFDRRALAIGPLEPLALLRRVTVPVRVMRGERSPVMEREPAAELAAAAGAPLVELPGFGHHLPLAAPEAVTEQIAAFAAELGLC